jgi:hypothetical protein
MRARRSDRAATVPAGAVSVVCVTYDRSTLAEQDYTATIDTVNFSDRDTTPQTVLIPITDDPVQEPADTLRVWCPAALPAALQSANRTAHPGQSQQATNLCGQGP